MAESVEPGPAGDPRSIAARVWAELRHGSLGWALGLAVLVALALNPIFVVPLPVLLAASAVGRSARFFGVAALIFFVGPGVKTFLDRYLELATVVLLVLFLGGIWAISSLR